MAKRTAKAKAAKPKAAKPAKLPKDVVETIRDQVRQILRSGFDSVSDVRAKVDELEPDQLFDEGTIDEAQLRTEARRALDAELAIYQREVKRWPKQTDNDRLDAAFRDLEDNHGILARQDYWCCQTCGNAAISDEMAKTRTKKRPGALGYVYFHNQDTESAVNNAGLYLAYGSADELDVRTRAVGRVIVSVLRDHGLAPSWDGDIGERIELPIDWRRRLPKRSVERP